MTTKLSLTKLSTPDSKSYLEKVGVEHRKHFGQFFTPPAVARFMTQWALGAGGKSLYDPGFGLGALLEPLAGRSHVDFTASEIDANVLHFWERATGCSPSFVANEDYLLSWGDRHDNIVCNPPYMRFQKFHNRDAALNSFAENLGLQLSGYTNTASAFLVKSLSELDNAGRLAYIMPLEFLNTGYGKVIKNELIRAGHLSAIISLDCEKDIVPDAITSVGIILYDAGVSHHAVNFHSVSSVNDLENILDANPVSRVLLSDLNPDHKWMSYFEQDRKPTKTTDMVKLDYYGRFSRGIATGANAFFTLRPSQARQWGLDHSECIPCITRSSQVRRAVFSPADYTALFKADAPVLLFTANGRLSPAAEGYVEFGEANDYHQRFITRTRTPWYKTEARDPAPMFLGVFARGDYKIIRNWSNAVSLSCFHGFRPNQYGRQYINHLFLYLASPAGRKIVAASMRRYGNALGKFEPNDANEAYVPTPAVFAELTDGVIWDALKFVNQNGRTPEYINALFADLL